MKKFFFIAFIFIINAAFLSIDNVTDNYDMPVDSETGKITYKEVIDEPGKPAELYDRAYAWAKKYFVNFSSTIKFRDKAAGIIKGNTRFKVQTTDKKGRKVYIKILRAPRDSWFRKGMELAVNESWIKEVRK